MADMKEEEFPNVDVMVKIGGSPITGEEAYTLDEDTLEDIAYQIGSWYRENTDVNMIVGNGGGSYAHAAAAENSLEGVGMARIHDAAQELNCEVVSRLHDEDVPAFSIQPSAVLVAGGGEPGSFYQTSIDHTLENNMVPVVYGDIVQDRQQGSAIFSTEDVFELLARVYSPGRTIIYSSTNGVYTEDPHENSDAERIETIENWEDVEDSLGGSHDENDQTGGMEAKVRSAQEIADNSGEVELVGEDPGNLAKALEGESPGTKVLF